MSSWRVHFYHQHSSETRSLIVEADNEDLAEIKASDEADRLGWDDGYRVGEAEPLD